MARRGDGVGILTQAMEPADCTLFIPGYQWTLAGVLHGGGARVAGDTRCARARCRPLTPTFPAWRELAALNGLLQHRVRLAICVLLSKYDVMSFSQMKDVLREKDGSLGTHLRKLEDAGYLAIDKTCPGGEGTRSGNVCSVASAVTLRLDAAAPVEEGDACGTIPSRASAWPSWPCSCR